MFPNTSKLLYVSYSEAKNLKEELHTKHANIAEPKKPKKRSSILFSIIQGPKLYA
jgi:hypothetical protein